MQTLVVVQQPPSHKEKWRLGVSLASVAAILFIVVAFMGRWTHGNASEMSMLKSAGWSLPPAFQNPAAAAAIASAAASSVEKGLLAAHQLRPSDSHSDADTQSMGETYADSASAHQRSLARSAEEEPGSSDKEVPLSHRLQHRGCAVWSRYCQEEIARTWNEEHREHKARQESYDGDQREGGLERGYRRDDDRQPEVHTYETRDGVEYARHPADPSDNIDRKQVVRSDRGLVWPDSMRALSSGSDDGDGNAEGTSDEQSQVNAAQNEQQYYGQPSGTSPEQATTTASDATAAGGTKDHDALGLKHFSMPHLPAETAVWVANQVASRASYALAHPSPPAPSGIDTAAQQAYAHGTHTVVVRREKVGLIPRPLGEDWEQRRKRTLGANRGSHTGAHVVLTREGLEEAAMERRKEAALRRLEAAAQANAQEQEQANGGAQGEANEVEDAIRQQTVVDLPQRAQSMQQGQAMREGGEEQGRQDISRASYVQSEGDDRNGVEGMRDDRSRYDSRRDRTSELRREIGSLLGSVGGENGRGGDARDDDSGQGDARENAVARLVEYLVRDRRRTPGDAASLIDDRQIDDMGGGGRYHERRRQEREEAQRVASSESRQGGGREEGEAREDRPREDGTLESSMGKQAIIAKMQAIERQINSVERLEKNRHLQA